MSDAWDDWEQADEADIQAPVPKLIPARKVSASPLPRAETGIIPAGQPQILKRNQQGPSGFGDQDQREEQRDGRSLHEKNRALWDKANAYEQPIIARNDNSMRTEYVPEIRILRRPKSPVAAARVPIKSKPLAEREAEYNAAREKIFGPSSTTTPATSPSSGSGQSGNLSNKSSTSSPSSSRPGSGRSSPALPAGQDSGFQQLSVKPIEFKGKPTLIRKAQKPSQDAVIRQPQGPTTMAATSFSQNHNNRGGGRGLQSSRDNGTSERQTPQDTQQHQHRPQQHQQQPASRGGRSIGFGKSLRGAPRHPAPSSPGP
ncbi:hypothetical protein EMPS_08416 [Entomortierella parvispora]|uniref:SUZ domain-containing protein n=1 Tax=Entomortierella parvispora TaxID=205924 RepID=A0A9P3LZE6_9FUNG|nr:hypothetical protein EMPS_08416 [Entomortierella parvispora]